MASEEYSTKVLALPGRKGEVAISSVASVWLRIFTHRIADMNDATESGSGMPPRGGPGVSRKEGLDRSCHPFTQAPSISP